MKPSRPNTEPEYNPEFTDHAIDTLASVLRDMGQLSFEVEGDADSTRFATDCEAWARHILTGTPAGEEPPPENQDAWRNWGGLRRFFRARRKQEKTFVASRLRDFRTVIWEVVDGLRTIAHDGRSTEETIQKSLKDLETVVEGGSLHEVRKALSKSVSTIHDALAEQRKTFDAQIQTMGETLASLREDLQLTQRKAELDPLTQIHNRGAFDESLRRYLDLSSLSGQPMVLLMVDIDHFKALNDRHGHLAGDKMLVAVADCLVRTYPRKNDFVARYGGEEFAIVLYDVESRHSQRLVNNLLKRIRATRTVYNDTELRVTCSVGYTQARPSDSPSSLVDRADAALYRAKREGRDRAVESD